MSEIDPDEPVGYLALPKGTPVVASDGVTVGTSRPGPRQEAR